MVIIASFIRLYLYSVIIFLIFYSCGFAQINSELTFITTQNPIIKPEAKEDLSLSFYETSEIKTVCMGMIRVYQLLISSQQNDKAICTFTPSCSHFGFAAIKKYGPFYGILMTSDRLQRCHGFSRKHYPIHPETGKLYDPIEHYYLRIK